MLLSLHNAVTLFHLQLTKEHISHNIQTSLTHRNQAWADYVQSQGGVDSIAELSVFSRGRARENECEKMNERHLEFILKK